MNKTIRVLLVEDDLDDTFLVEETLAACAEYTFHVTRTENLSSAIELLMDQAAFDVALLDLSLPDSRGIDTLIALYASQIQLPIIVLTGLRDEAMAERMFRLGALGYLVKGIDDINSLPNSIIYAIEQHALRTKTRQQYWVQRQARTLQAIHHLWQRTTDGATKADAYGLAPEGQLPPTFYALIDQYRSNIAGMLEGPAEEDDDTAGALAALAVALADAHAGPRDVVMLHEAALQANAAEEAVEYTGFDIAQSLQLIRVLGHLVAVYRERAREF